MILIFEFFEITRWRILNAQIENVGRPGRYLGYLQLTWYRELVPGTDIEAWPGTSMVILVDDL
jgi:hypothetical protein